MRLLRYFFKVTLIVVGVLFLMVLSDLINPQKEIEVKIEPHFYVYPDDVDDPWNREARIETAWNLDTDVDTVTQEQFNERYLNPQN